MSTNNENTQIEYIFLPDLTCAEVDLNLKYIVHNLNISFLKLDTSKSFFFMCTFAAMTTTTAAAAAAATINSDAPESQPLLYQFLAAAVSFLHKTTKYICCRVCSLRRHVHGCPLLPHETCCLIESELV